jgi:hypothetical protein
MVERSLSTKHALWNLATILVVVAHLVEVAQVVARPMVEAAITAVVAPHTVDLVTKLIRN